MTHSTRSRRGYASRHLTGRDIAWVDLIEIAVPPSIGGEGERLRENL